MPHPRAPLWLYLLAACFLGLFALHVSAELWGPGPAGFDLELRGGRMIVRGVLPGFPAERAGLQAGDWVVVANGQLIHTVFDWRAIEANTQVGRPLRLEIERVGERREATLAFDDSSWKRWTTRDWIDFFAVQTAQLLMLGLALLIAFRRPQDLAARFGAWFLGSLSVSSGRELCGFAAIWRSLPLVLGAPLWIPYSSFTLCPALLFTFFAVFPRPFFRTRWWWSIWLTALFFPPLLLCFSYHVVYHPDRTSGLIPPWFIPLAALAVVVSILAGSVMLVLNYFRLEDFNERRRVRLLVVGSVVGFLATIIRFTPLYLESPSTLRAFLHSPPVVVTSNLLFLLFPLSYAYTILRHKLFDIRVMFRQGVQYALARRLVLSLVPLLAAILLLDLFVHGDQPLLAVVRQRGWIYLALGALALTAHLQRRSWMDALDRRFFRERYDAQRLLRDVAEQIRAAGSFEAVGPLVVASIEEALHPEFAALLRRAPADTHFRCQAVAPTGQAPPLLPAESKLVGLVRLFGKPFEVPHAESGWLQQLPHEETDFLRRARIDLIVPVSTGAARSEVLLVLGVKRSEEPYSREDNDLLLAIASSLAILLEKPPTLAPSVVTEPEPAFEECSQCGVCFDSGTGRCPQEGALLVRTLLPRTLVGRYHLEKRLGRGGMGTVYRASDTALERPVAVKVIRDDLIGSADAAERFRREAKASAGFAHPNVVTVHDFGVAAATRAFLVMELLSGHSLREELRREKRLPPARVLSILRGACAAVDAAHRRGLVHRDLKPENIFLARRDLEEIPKVLDFGVAKFLPAESQATRDADTGAGLLVGTFRYMSPEQLSGQPVDPSWDVWALAVLAYEMLAGEFPFAGQSALDLQRAVLQGHFTPLSCYLPSAPPHWQEFFSRALARDSLLRPPSAQAFLAALESVLSPPIAR
jgi:tRNA A-37 threonylcarbamoyl transferase component Bud32